MRGLTRFFRLSVSLCALVLLGCGSGGLTPGPRQVGDFEMNLVLDKPVYAPGEPVAATFTVKNLYTQTLDFDIGPCYDFVSEIEHVGPFDPSGGPPVGCAGVTHKFILQPGEPRSYSVIWDQKDPQRNQVSAGTYRMVVRMVFGSANGQGFIDDRRNDFFANPVDAIIAAQ
jgi:hypothetical protein